MGESGKVGGEGHFTISREKAREKLAQFLLPEARHYVLNLVACAISSGAETIDVKVGPRTTIFGFDGPPFSASELSEILSQVVAPTDVRLQELGVAVNALLSLPVGNILIESWGEDKGTLYEWNGKSWRLEELGGCPIVGRTTWNRIWTTEGVSLSRSSQGTFGTLPEREVLKTRACFLPAKLVVNEMPVNRLVKLGSRSETCLAWAHFTHDEVRIQACTPKKDWSTYCQIFNDLPSGAQFEAILTLDFEPESDDRGLLFLVDGISFRRPQSVLGMPYIQGVVSTRLRKNASHTDLVEDGLFHELLDQIKVLAEDLLVERLDSDTPIPRDYFAKLLKVCDEVGPRLQARRIDHQARRLQSWVARARFLTDLRSASKWAKVVSDLHSAPWAELKVLRKRIRQGLAALALDGVENLDYNSSQLACWRLHQLGEIMEADWTAEALVGLALVDGLLGKIAAPESPWELLRLNGGLEDALSRASSDLQKAQILMGLERFSEAKTLLEGQNLDNLEVLDALSDLFAFSSEVRDPGQALSLRERAVSKRAARAVNWGNFQLGELLQLSRAASFATHLHYRGQSFRQGEPEGYASVLAMELERAEGLLVKGNQGGLVALNSALLAAEKRLPLNHAFLEAARSRAVHMLRRYGYWRGADLILARAAVVNGLTELLLSLKQR